MPSDTTRFLACVDKLRPPDRVASLSALQDMAQAFDNDSKQVISEGLTECATACIGLLHLLQPQALRHPAGAAYVPGGNMPFDKDYPCASVVLNFGKFVHQREQLHIKAYVPLKSYHHVLERAGAPQLPTVEQIEQAATSKATVDIYAFRRWHQFAPVLAADTIARCSYLLGSCTLPCDDSAVCACKRAFGCFAVLLLLPVGASVTTSSLGDQDYIRQLHSKLVVTAQRVIRMQL